MTPELVAAFRLLTPQLSRTSPAPGGHELAEMVRSPATVLLMARDPDRGLVGSLTLVLFRIPTGLGCNGALTRIKRTPPGGENDADGETRAGRSSSRLAG